MGLQFNGIDLKDKFNFITTEVTGRDLPPVTREEMELMRIDGTTITSERYDKRDIEIKGVIYDSTVTGVKAKRKNLLRLLSSSYASAKVLAFPDTNRGIYVRLATGESTTTNPVGPQFNAYAYEIQLKFVAHIPFFFPLELTPSNENGVAKNMVSFGNFELDTGENEVSIGWGLTHSGIRASFIDGTVGEYAQRLYMSNTGTELNVGIKQDVEGLHEEEIIFVTAFLKKISVESLSTNAPKILCEFKNNTGKTITDVDASTSGGVASITDNVQFDWLQVADKITVPYNAEYMTLHVVQTTPHNNVGMFAVDAVQVNNLSLLGMDIQDMTISQLKSTLKFTCLEG